MQRKIFAKFDITIIHSAYYKQTIGEFSPLLIKSKDTKKKRHTQINPSFCQNIHEITSFWLKAE